MARRRPQGRRAGLGIKAKLDLVGEMVKLRLVWPDFQETHGPLWVFIQPGCEHRSGSPCSDDDAVVLLA